MVQASLGFALVHWHYPLILTYGPFLSESPVRRTLGWQLGITGHPQATQRSTIDSDSPFHLVFVPHTSSGNAMHRFP